MPQDEDFKLPKQNTLAKRLDKNKLDKAAADDIIESHTKLIDLPKNQILILHEEIYDFMSESSRTIAQIAKKLKIHVQTVYYAHRSRAYKACKQSILHELFMQDSQVFYTALVKAAKNEKIGAIRLGLEVQGIYTPKHQTENVNVNVNVGSDNMTPIAAIERFLTMLGARGWSIEQLTEIWNNLKQSQAF